MVLLSASVISSHLYPSCKAILSRHLSVNKPKVNKSANYCESIVKKYDYENFLCTLLLPKNIRSSAFAIRAFNVEIANALGQTKENHIAQMRMKFWEDTLDKIFLNSPPQQPVALELSKAVKSGVSKRNLKRLITSRTENLKLTTFPTLQSMENFAESTVSSVFYAILEAANIKNVHADHAASHLGKAQGIVNLIRGIPYNIKSGKIYLPQDILINYNLSQESIFRSHNSKPFQDAIFEIASRAHQHLEKARNLKKTVPKEVNPIFLPAFTVESSLEKLRIVEFNVFNSQFQSKDNMLPLKLFWKKLFNKY